MKTLAKAYIASCLIVAGFFLFISIPWEMLPFSDAVDVMVVGGIILAVSSGVFIYSFRQAGFEFGWFLARRGGFWVIVAAFIGLIAMLCGILLFVSPELFVPVFEQGSLPIAMIVISMFWMALIFMFGFLAFQALEDLPRSFRSLRIRELLGTLGLGAFCLFLAAVFVSLYLDVINDNAFRISEASRRSASWLFAVLLAISALTYGFFSHRKAQVTDDA